jgi:hypothetical protein
MPKQVGRWVDVEEVGDGGARVAAEDGGAEDVHEKGVGAAGGVEPIHCQSLRGRERREAVGLVRRRSQAGLAQAGVDAGGSVVAPCSSRRR